jgi:hypothetical protein
MNDLARKINNASNNKITDLAKYVYSSLSFSACNDTMPLANNYIGQVGHILEASKWAENPGPISQCNQDIDDEQINYLDKILERFINDHG